MKTNQKTITNRNSDKSQKRRSRNPNTMPESSAAEHKQTEEKLLASEVRYRRLFEAAKDGILILDGNTGEIVDVNPFLMEMLGYSHAEFLGKQLWEISLFKDIAANKDSFLKLQEERYIRYENLPLETKDGHTIWVEFVSNAYEVNGKQVIQCNIRNITERKRVEEALSKEQHEMQTLMNYLPISIYFKDRANRFTRISKSQALRFGLSDLAQAIGKTDFDFFTEEHARQAYEDEQAIIRTGQPLIKEEKETWADRPDRWVSTIKMPMRDNEGNIIGTFGLSTDITERKQAEDELRQSEEKFRNLFNNSEVGMFRTRFDGSEILEFNEKYLKILGYTLDEVKGKPSVDMWADKQERDRMVQLLKTEGRVTDFECGILNKQGEVRRCITSLRLYRDTGILEGSIQDITERRQAEEKIQQHLHRLSALRDIDLVIKSNFDLKVTLNILLGHVTAQLGVDAAAVLLFRQSMNELEFAAGRGFHTANITRLRLKLGEEYSGRAALERRTIAISNLAKSQEPFDTKFIEGEGFVTFFAVPLIAKGKVKGVLEVFHRSPFKADADWLNFLEALAGQTAIAIDNSELFGNLQQSNLELQLAYDKTIEGWSRALDLRDKETEGHTQRVTKTALRLASAMGLSDDELIQVRRGALLHDIGKIGVPDQILLKPGDLTEEESAAMRKHPQFAFDLFSSIDFLRPALDIPYCHHEKWDGTGYPRGLKGEQIPLTARIFAIVDVYDALTSDRPYRLAWTKEKALEHIQSEAGKYFDPNVVQEFVEVIKKD
jgi:PAS domain S-box-containing protein